MLKAFLASTSDSWLRDSNPTNSPRQPLRAARSSSSSSHAIGAHLTEIGNHVGHGFLQGLSPRRRHHAELALIDAAAGGLDGVRHVDQAARVKLALGKGEVRELEIRTLIVAPLH